MTNTSLEGTTAKAIGETIRDARVRLDMTKAEAARRAGVSRRTWHEVEEGTRPASSAETLALFDQVLGFDEGTLFAMTSRSTNRRIEGLRQQAIDLVKLMSSDDLELFVASRGQETVSAQLADLQHQLVALRQELAPRIEEAARDAGDTVPRGGSGRQRRT